MNDHKLLEICQDFADLGSAVQQQVHDVLDGDTEDSPRAALDMVLRFAKRHGLEDLADNAEIALQDRD